MDRTVGFRIGCFPPPRQFTLPPRLAGMLGAMLAVYWGLALPAAAHLGLDWTPFLWRVPLAGLSIVGLLACWRLLPAGALLRQLQSVEEPLDGESPLARKLALDAVRVRRAALFLPVGLPLAAVLVTLLGVGPTPTEQVASFVLATSVVIGLVVYFATSSMVGPIVLCCNQLALPVRSVRLPLFAKLLTAMLVLVWLNQVFGAPAALVLSVAMAWALSRPLSALARQVRNRAPGFYSDDETGALSTAFSHELREGAALRDQLSHMRDDMLLKVHQRTQDMKEQSALLEVSRAVTSTLHLDRVLEEIVTRTRDLMDADGCTLWLRHLDTLELKASMGLDRSLHPPVVPMNAFSSGLTQFGRPHILRVDQASQLAETVRAALRAQNVQVMVAAALASRGNTVGVLGVYYREPRDADVDRSLDLLTTVASQAAVAIENARLYERQQYITHLLRVSLSPREPLGFPGIQVGHRLHPSLELSGDYYDLIPIGPNRFDVVMADVAGKGPDAAIQTARAKSIIHAHATAGLRPGRVLALLNKQMLAEAEDMHLVTVFYGQVDLEKREFTYACAGHEPALMWGTGSPEMRLLYGAGIIIGVAPEPHYENYVVPIADGTTVLLYTDGVTEARSPEGDFFGVDGLLQLVSGNTALSPHELVNRIFVAVNRFSEGHITDDLSLLAFRINDVMRETGPLAPP